MVGLSNKFKFKSKFRFQKTNRDKKVQKTDKTDKTDKIISSILVKIKPTSVDENKAYDIFEIAKRYIETCAKRLRVKGKLTLTGSLAKGTFLKGNHDIDVFFLVSKNVVIDKNFVIRFKDCLKTKMDKVELDYAQHPYISANIDSWILDIVPAYNIKDTSYKKSAVDRTVFHTKYVLSHISDKEKDEVRILKQFLKANNIYGAEMKIEGFPGYLCELMIIRYKSFIKFLEAVLGWKIGEFIDIENHHNLNKNNENNENKESSSKNAYALVREKFDNPPLIVIDPTDKNRNVASALSYENFLKLKDVASKFLENPSKKFFKIRKITKAKILSKLKSELKHPSQSLFKIRFKTIYENEESNWGKLKRISRQITDRMEQLGVKTINHGLFIDKNMYMFFIFGSKKLPKTIKFKGPTKKYAQEYIMFKKMHLSSGDKIVEKDGELYAIRTRTDKERDITSILQDIIHKLIPNATKLKIEHK